ncbi:hypothetical protein V5R04_07020 [Jonesiaceae bacterium BS-20]|uniref:Uncharacterized protein n=1 Tax=Jonesiaceae bacterium BS-20 TaxID=3120821 RepID=A0AAU7E082_9MICO
MTIIQLDKSSLPSGFRFFGEARGRDAGEFGLSDRQLAHRYIRGEFSHSHILTVCWSDDPVWQLTGTEGREPLVVEEGVEYFDGEWAAGPGDMQLDTVVGPVHWTSNYRHTVKVTVANGVLGIRANPLLLDLEALLFIGRAELKLMEV